MGFIADAIEDIGDFIGDTIEAVVDNPIGAIVSLGGMALGIPPVYAGALGGAANAAANDGNILEGALLGGVTGYVGGAAGQAAANAGANAALAGAAGGAAAGATSAALTGGDIIQGALTGGALGGASGFIAGQVMNQDGTYTRTNDDGSVIRFNSNGDILQVSPATDGTPAPVYDYNPATQQLELVSSNGTNALNILDAQQTAELMRNIDPNLINSFADTGGGGGFDGDMQAVDAGSDGAGGGQPYRVEIGGLPGTAENPGYAIVDARTPGTNLATFDQIDAGLARWNPAANAWEVGDFSIFEPTDTNFGAFGEAPTGGTGPVLPGEVVTTPTTPAYTGPEIFRFDDGSSITINPDGTTSFTDSTGGTSSMGGGTAYASEGGATTYRFDDGSWMTINPDGSSIVADSDGTVTTHAGGTYTGTGTGGQTTDLQTVEITAPRLTNTGDTGDVQEVVITAPRIPADTTVTTPADTTVTTPGDGGTIPYNPVQTPTPVTPVFPVITPGGNTGGGDGSTPTSTGPGGPIQNINLPPGLNPGWIAPTPFYNTTSPAQSQFYWGAHPFQPGPTFNAQLYNQSVGAPATPWGLQNIAQPLTPQEVTRAYQGQPIVRAPLPVATRVEAPQTQMLYTQPLTATATAQPYTTQVVAGPVVPA